MLSVWTVLIDMIDMIDNSISVAITDEMLRLAKSPGRSTTPHLVRDIGPFILVECPPNPASLVLSRFNSAEVSLEPIPTCHILAQSTTARSIVYMCEVRASSPCIGDRPASVKSTRTCVRIRQPYRSTACMAVTWPGSCGIGASCCLRLVFCWPSRMLMQVLVCVRDLAHMVLGTCLGVITTRDLLEITKFSIESASPRGHDDG